MGRCLRRELTINNVLLQDRAPCHKPFVTTPENRINFGFFLEKYETNFMDHCDIILALNVCGCKCGKIFEKSTIHCIFLQSKNNISISFSWVMVFGSKQQTEIQTEIQLNRSRNEYERLAREFVVSVGEIEQDACCQSVSQLPARLTRYQQHTAQRGGRQRIADTTNTCGDTRWNERTICSFCSGTKMQVSWCCGVMVSWCLVSHCINMDVPAVPGSTN